MHRITIVTIMAGLVEGRGLTLSANNGGRHFGQFAIFGLVTGLWP